MTDHIHILPVNDIREHKETGADCLCGPRTEPVDGTDTVLIIHNSFDGREGLELANEVLNKRK